MLATCFVIYPNKKKEKKKKNKEEIDLYKT